MDAVKSFNSELSSLYEVKPPISKAKMTALTRGAIKAIKFYKHVVQSVEKFILKCKPEYKVPGLYVIDSIVRQSRHQFGPEKDVFAPRFAKNMQQTFINLFKCPPEDKSKIIRVLNLWQKNQVFNAEVIQPLFDLADPNNPIYQQIQQQQQSTPVQQSNGAAGTQQQVAKGSPALQRTPTKANQSTEGAAANLNLTEPVIQQLQQLQRLLTKGADVTPRSEQVHFDKKLLDFDYDDDDDEVNPSPRPPPQPSDSVTSLLTNPEVLRQLQTLQNTLAGAVPAQPDIDVEKMKKLQEMKLQEDEFDKHLAQTVPNLPFASECEFKPSNNSSMIGGFNFIPPSGDSNQLSQGYDVPQHENNGGFSGSQNSGTGNDVEVITLDHDDSHSPGDRYGNNKRKRSRSRSRDRGRGDRERDNNRRTRRSRSRSRSRRYRSKSREKDRKEKEKKEKEKETERDKERKKRGLPAIKKDNLTVCSTTLWVGHLSKLVHQDDLSNTFGEFGDVVSIDLIPPRGCAFIVMHRRQDAARCLNKLKNHNLHGKAITLAWAPGKGVKGKDLKDYWEGDLGVSYIPWSKIKEDIDLELLEDGGMIDEDTMPPWMKDKMEEMNKKRNLSAPVSDQPQFLMAASHTPARDAPSQSTIDTSRPPPLPGTNLLQPPLLPLVSPFQFNNRLLSMMPNMTNMPNLPMGVPPPNMPPPMMPNLGLGLSSPFQGPPGLMPAQMSLENKPTPPPTSDASLRALGESLMNLAGQPLSSMSLPPQPPMNQPHPPISQLHPPMNQPHPPMNQPHPSMNQPHPQMNQPHPQMNQPHPQMNQHRPPMNQPRPPMNQPHPPMIRPHPPMSQPPPPHNMEDSMDIEMEDAGGHNEKLIPLSEQLQASLQQSSGFGNDRRDEVGGRRDRRDDRSRRRSRSRDREQISDRDRSRGGQTNSRDRERRDRDRDTRDFGRNRDRNDRDRDNRDRRSDRERNNRWGGTLDRREPDLRDDRREREKTLNERLKEMAGMNFEEPPREKLGPRDRRTLDTGPRRGPRDDNNLRFEPPALEESRHFGPPPKSDFGPPKSDFGTPKSDFGPNKSESKTDFAISKPNFDLPKLDFGSSKAEFGTSNPEKVKPKSDFATPNPDFDALKLEDKNQDILKEVDQKKEGDSNFKSPRDRLDPRHRSEGSGFRDAPPRDERAKEGTPKDEVSDFRSPPRDEGPSDFRVPPKDDGSSFRGPSKDGGPPFKGALLENPSFRGPRLDSPPFRGPSKGDASPSEKLPRGACEVYDFNPDRPPMRDGQGFGELMDGSDSFGREIPSCMDDGPQFSNEGPGFSAMDRGFGPPDFGPPSRVDDSPRGFDGPPGGLDGPPGGLDDPSGGFDDPSGGFDGPPGRFDGPPGRFDGPPGRFDGPPGRFDGPPGRFDGPPGRFDGPPGGFSGPPGRFDGPPGGFDGPPGRFDGPPGRFDGPPGRFDGPPGGFNSSPREFGGPPEEFDGPPGELNAPPGEFNGPPGEFDGPPGGFDGPPRSFDGPPDMMDGPPRGFDCPPDFGPPDDMMDGPPARFMRGGRRGDWRNRRGGPPDFFPPHDDFGPRGPMISRGGPDFGSRGHRGRGGFFGPRGPRGPRGQRGGLQFRDGPGGFDSTFDRPPEFFRGRRGGPRSVPFDEPFHRGRGGRFRARGRPAPDFFNGPPGPDFFDGPPGPGFFDGPPRPPFEGGPPFKDGPPPFQRPGRGGKKSRWANSHDSHEQPQEGGEHYGNTENKEGPSAEMAGDTQNFPVETVEGGGGNSTPLRDETFESGPAMETGQQQEGNQGGESEAPSAE